MRLLLIVLIGLLASPVYGGTNPRWVDLQNGSLQIPTQGSNWKGGSGTFFVDGVFDSAVVTFFSCTEMETGTACSSILKCSLDTTLTGCTFFAAPSQLRVTITGGQGAESISVKALGPTQASIGVGFSSITESFPDTLYEPLSAAGKFKILTFGGGDGIEFDPSIPAINSVLGNWEFQRESNTILTFANAFNCESIQFAPFVPNMFVCNNTSAFNTDLGDGTTGLAVQSNTDEVHTLINQVQVLTVDATGVTIIGCKHFGQLSTAPTGTRCDQYYDTDTELPCFHDGTGFVQFTDGSTACV